MRNDHYKRLAIVCIHIDRATEKKIPAVLIQDEDGNVYLCKKCYPKLSGWVKRGEQGDVVTMCESCARERIANYE
jgi:hypothetical protein